jgi:hypothetical protein
MGIKWQTVKIKLDEYGKGTVFIDDKELTPPAALLSSLALARRNWSQSACMRTSNTKALQLSRRIGGDG